MRPRFAIVPSVALEDLFEVARSEGWAVLAALEEREDAPFQIVWDTPGGAGTVTYVEDAMLDVRYVQVDGPHERVAEALGSRGMIFSVSDIAELAEASETPQGLLVATCYVGVAAGEHADRGLLSALERALGDPNAEVRRVGVMASAYAGWPELLPRLEQIEHADPDPEARNLAARVVASLRTSNDQEAAR